VPRIQKERDTSARSSIGVRTWFSSCWFGPLRVSIPAKPVICRGDPACPSTPPGDELASVHQERACPGLRPRCFYRHKRGTKLKSSSLSCVRIGRLPRKNHPAPGSMLRKGHSPEKIRCLLTCSDRDKSRLRGNRTPRKSNSIYFQRDLIRRRKPACKCRAPSTLGQTSESEAAKSGVSVGSKVGFCTRITGWVK
jgi:hypothetical protein